MSPIIVDRKEKAKEITLAALELFSKNGYNSTSVEQIARTAGMGKGTIYEYFSTKEDIFISVIRYWSTVEQEKMSIQINQLTNPVDQLYCLTDIIISFYEGKNQYTFRLFNEVMQQTFRENGILYHRPELIQELSAWFRKMVVDILLNGISDGIFRSDIARDAEKIAINFMAFLDGIGLHWMISSNHFSLRDQIRSFMKGLIHLIVIDEQSKNLMVFE